MTNKEEVLKLIEMEGRYGARTCSGLRKSGSTILRNIKHQILSRSWIKDVLGNESWSLNI